MKKRRIFFWMGLTFLFVFGLSQEGFTKETYKVRRGDTLAKIAGELGVSVQDLKRTNGLKGTALKPGQVLSVSKSSSKSAKASKKQQVAKSGKTSTIKSESYSVKKGDTLQSISKKTGVSIAQLKSMNRLRSHALKPGQKLVLARHQSVAKESRRTEAASVAEIVSDELYLEDDSEDGEAVEEDWASVERDKEASAELLGKWNSPKERQIFMRVVRGFLGTPYRFGGSSVRGIDCSGFVAKVYQFFDVKLPRTAREQSRMGVRVAKSELEEGDLVFFNTRRAFGHVGIYIGNNEFIHASSGRNSGKNVRIDSLDKPYYNQRFIKAVRVKGLKGAKAGEPDLS